MQTLLPLSTSEMSHTCAHFAQIQEFLISEMSPETLLQVERWISTRVLLNKPVYMMRPDAIFETTDAIFKDETITDFVCDLAFRFFSTWSVGEDSPKRLCLSLANGLEIDYNEGDMCIIPPQVRGSMPVSVFSSLEAEGKTYSLSGSKKKINTFDFLNDNRHLVIVFMLYLTNKSN